MKLTILSNLKFVGGTKPWLEHYAYSTSTGREGGHVRLLTTREVLHSLPAILRRRRAQKRTPGPGVWRLP